MIKFTAQTTLVSLEDKKIAKKDGGEFAFTEATLKGNDKNKTLIKARCPEGFLDETPLQKDEKGLATLGLTSYETPEGRVFNNFILLDFVRPPKQQSFKTEDVGDEIPF